jgi:hypothetical protein
MTPCATSEECQDIWNEQSREIPCFKGVLHALGCYYSHTIGLG